jgi:hypothetical protein
LVGLFFGVGLDVWYCLVGVGGIRCRVKVSCELGWG